MKNIKKAARYKEQDGKDISFKQNMELSRSFGEKQHEMERLDHH